MNILPKKRWHVRTKDNIARVRRDEAQAAEEEKKLKKRIQLAEQEAKLSLLRNNAKQRYDDSADRPADELEKINSKAPSHVNFFQDLEDGHVAHTGVNIEHEQEKKEEKEAYEKKIGYLTYLGQDTDESTGNVQWYNKKPKRLDLRETDKEIETKYKILNDPLMVIKKYVDCGPKDKKFLKEPKKELSIKKKEDSPARKHKKKKKKKEKEKDKEKEEKKLTLEKLREKRLKREREERFRASQLLAKMNGIEPKEVPKPQSKPAIVQKYNSQFNPYLARQNYPTSSTN